MGSWCSKKEEEKSEKKKEQNETYFNGNNNNSPVKNDNVVIPVGTQNQIPIQQNEINNSYNNIESNIKLDNKKENDEEKNKKNVNIKFEEENEYSIFNSVNSEIKKKRIKIIEDANEEDKKIRGGEVIFEEEERKKFLETFPQNNKKPITDSYLDSKKESRIDSKKESIIYSKKKEISLGINIGALKTVYSTFSKINDKHITNVLLMNNSSRIIPSIICYTKDHRLFGENSISFLKQNLNTSYNNLSRLIGFDNSNKYEEELKYMFRKEDNINDYKFYCYDKNQKKKIIEYECIIADYLSLIKEYYFEKEKIYYDFTTISVPDYFNLNQKEELKLICEEIGMNEVKIINESSAITMYYGYTKYNDLFGNGSQISKDIDKNILFIDIGYSKTSIILSNFKFNGFSVKKVKYLPNFGGRYFDEIIANNCIKEFIKTNDIDIIEISDRMKYRLLEVIRKERPNLSINDEIKILVDSFYEEQDLEIYIKSEKYENEIISNDDSYLDFISILKEIKDENNNQNIKIDYVEIAGEFMRTPFLQKKVNDIFKENKEKIISTTILIDECTSVGAALLGSYLYGEFHLNLEYFDYLDYSYDDNNNTLISNQQIVIGKEEIKKHIESLKGNKSQTEKEQFKSKIKTHIVEQSEIDKKYDNLIKKKSDKSKSLFFLKNYASKNNGLKGLLKQLNELERRLRNIELTDIKLQDLNNDLDTIYKDAYSIENKRIEEKMNEALSLIKEKELNNEKEIEKNILKYKEKIEKLFQKEDNIKKFNELIEIENDFNQLLKI